MKLITLCLLSLLLFSCNGVFYQPSRKTFYEIDKEKIDYRDVYYGGESHKSLHGRFFPHVGDEESKGLIVHYHGNAQNITTHFLAFIWMTYKGYDYFIWDYSGFGQSKGLASREKLQSDGITTMDMVLDSFPSAQKNLFVFAQSLGGAIAVPVLGEWEKSSEVDLLLIDASFPSYRKAARDVLSRSWLTWIFQPLSYVLISEEYSPMDYYSKVSHIPTVVSHCKEDGVVSYELGEMLYESIVAPKAFLPFEKCGHISAFSRYRPQNHDVLLATIDSLMSVPPQE